MSVDHSDSLDSKAVDLQTEHEDENSETESAIAMTQLSPEENQGGKLECCGRVR